MNRAPKHLVYGLLVSSLMSLLIILTVAPSAAIGGNAPVFRLDTASATWTQLPSNNEFATVVRSSPLEGGCNKQVWSIGIVNRLQIVAEPQEIRKEATAVTSNIITLESGSSFRVPVGEIAVWKVTVTVNNLNQDQITGVNVADRFGAEFAVAVDTVSQGSVTISTVGAAKQVHLHWSVGNLSAGASAQLILLVATKKNPAGIQQFSSPGVYDMNSGATLKYLLKNKQYSATSGTIAVQALAAGLLAFTTINGQ